MSGWDDIKTEYDCPICGADNCVPASGLRSSPVLVVAEFPGEEEVKYGKPMVGRMGTIIRTELGYMGIDFKRLRVCNLWLHTPNKNEECKQYGAKKVIEEAQSRKVILLLGSDAVKYFTTQDVSKVNGLKVTSPYFSAPIIMACVSPATVFHQSVGELRLSLQKFAKEVEGLL